MIDSSLEAASLQISAAPGWMSGLASSQSKQILYPSPSPSGIPSSVVPLQLSSMPLQTSVAPGWTAGLVSLQSPWHSLSESPSSSASVVPARAGQFGALQSLLTPSQTGGAPG